MVYQSVFRRHELKYLIDTDQKNLLIDKIRQYMSLDKYGKTTIRNIYLDTDNYRLIRRSIEKPIYKEKLRIRSYCKTTPESTVFVELKKKYDSVVYKRRVAMTESEAYEWLSSGEKNIPESQITKEIDYFMSYYGTLRPTVFLSYDREAYYSKDGSDLRVTFDQNLLCRTDDISLESDTGGTSILLPGKHLMEIKTSGGIPVWLTDLLSREKIYKTSFSKYGKAYEKLILSNKREDI